MSVCKYMYIDISFMSVCVCVCVCVWESVWVCMEESVHRALHGALITYPEGEAGSKRRRLD